MGSVRVNLQTQSQIAGLTRLLGKQIAHAEKKQKKMKKCFLGLIVISLLTAALFFERSQRAWPLEQHFIGFLARVTHHDLPIVTAVKMPLVSSRLSQQDLALALRAVVSFHPRQILILEPVEETSSKTFSILQEAMANGEVQRVPIHFLTNEKFFSNAQKNVQNIHLISLEDLLLHREERERGAIVPQLDTLFSDQTILIGGPPVVQQGAVFIDQAEKKMMTMPSVGLELIILLLLFLLMWKVIHFSWIDFLLILSGIFFCFVGINAWLFQERHVVYPLLAPSLILIMSAMKKFFPKLLSCTKKVKQ